jgi:hypothetical protein
MAGPLWVGVWLPAMPGGQTAPKCVVVSTLVQFGTPPKTAPNPANPLTCDNAHGVVGGIGHQGVKLTQTG